MEETGEEKGLATEGTIGFSAVDVGGETDGMERVAAGCSRRGGIAVDAI